ncbi:MAG TPA: class I SAM-dependent rRNA methyltransferase, partial [Kofleriaceae bacterium]|nr:class I SAM-dependent rRNA methyltransferase [Kofleriaceae bacterium]
VVRRPDQRPDPDAGKRTTGDGRRTTIRLTKPLRDAIAGGHPWIYDRACAPLAPGAKPGALAVIVDDRGPLACGYVDPDGPIRARVCALDPDAALDDGWAHGRARAAAAARAADPLLADCDALRAIHGENDRMPGLVVDLYAGCAVLVMDGDAAARFWRPRLEAVLRGLADGGLPIETAWLRPVRGGEGGAGEALRGEPPATIAIRERGARFDVDVRRGQKTGFFLDQRDNRSLVARYAAGARVLNLFAYTGGFSVHAALAGAAHVTTVDLASPAIESAKTNFTRSGLDPAAHAFAAVDAFAFLEDARAHRRTWDVVICDPPSFAPNERARAKAIGAYAKLFAASAQVVEPGGLLAAASCSSHVTELDFLGALADAQRRARRTIVARVIAGAASDHPVVPGFPEGRYLKFALTACD